MAITIGRLREDTQYDYKFVCLSHNTLRGAAGGAVLLAEQMCIRDRLYVLYKYPDIKPIPSPRKAGSRHAIGSPIRHNPNINGINKNTQARSSVVAKTVNNDCDDLARK